MEHVDPEILSLCDIFCVNETEVRRSLAGILKSYNQGDISLKIIQCYTRINDITDLATVRIKWTNTLGRSNDWGAALGIVEYAGSH